MVVLLIVEARPWPVLAGLMWSRGRGGPEGVIAAVRLPSWLRGPEPDGPTIM
jgi:hypothetical protein